MSINRYDLVTRHNPILTEIDTDSPLTIGNGRIAFTADITGFQSFSAEYEKTGFPLCTMSEWGWHTIPSKDLRPLELTEYITERGSFRYPVKKFPGNETTYDWLRQNPHRLNLGKIAIKTRNEDLHPQDIFPIKQELHLYSGIIESLFLYCGTLIRVLSACDPKTDTFAWEISANKEGLPNCFSIEISFPYGSSSISGSDWSCPERHRTNISFMENGTACAERRLDGNSYHVMVSAGEHALSWNEDKHQICIKPFRANAPCAFSVRFSPDNNCGPLPKPHTVFENSRLWWKDFWEQGGAIDFEGSTNACAHELERRIVLSQYVLAIQSCGTIPPAETGLTCNSWYGKFHLEMYPLHTAWLPLWNRGELLERSLPWFLRHLDKACENAAKNGFSGARWPKMIDPSGEDSPSPIAPLLVWQQPHILYLLELLYSTGKDRAFLERYRDIVFETASFMVDFAVFDCKTGTWNIEAPVIPAQEEHDPMNVRNPAFELAYWSHGLHITMDWLERLGETVPVKWREVAIHMAPMAKSDGLYIAHENCPDTFTDFNRDHPSMLMSFGFIDGGHIDREAMRKTLRKVLECWDYQSLWGWDFAMMAMTAAKLDEPKIAIDTLLCDTEKNTYVASGNNYQKSRTDLPLYLPGNGSLLLAMTMGKKLFPDDGTWKVEFEGIKSLPERR